LKQADVNEFGLMKNGGSEVGGKDGETGTGDGSLKIGSPWWWWKTGLVLLVVVIEALDGIIDGNVKKGVETSGVEKRGVSEQL